MINDHQRHPFCAKFLKDLRDPLDLLTRQPCERFVHEEKSRLHVIVKGSLPEGRNRQGDIELYETARFFKVIGDHLDGTPKSVAVREGALTGVTRTISHQKRNRSHPKQPLVLTGDNHPPTPAAMEMTSVTMNSLQRPETQPKVRSSTDSTAGSSAATRVSRRRIWHSVRYSPSGPAVTAPSGSVVSGFRLDSREVG